MRVQLPLPPLRSRRREGLFGEKRAEEARATRTRPSALDFIYLEKGKYEYEPIDEEIATRYPPLPLFALWLLAFNYSFNNFI